MSAIFAVAGKLVTLFIYVLVGYVVSKRKMISEGFSAGISRFLLVVTIPCLILSTFETDYTFERLVKAGEVYVISLIIFGASILIGYLTAWILRISEESKSVWIYSVTFTNHAFMGWAVMDAVFGGESIFMRHLPIWHFPPMPILMVSGSCGVPERKPERNIL